MSDSIGVRELRQYASTYLARVKEGESITVTERGKPIARLVPLGEGSSSWRQDWIERGLLRPATLPASSWLEFEPIGRSADEPSLSEVLDEVRREGGEPAGSHG